MQMGTVTGVRRGKYLGLANAQILQVQIESKSDIEDVLLLTPPGVDSAPAPGERVIVLALAGFMVATGGSDPLPKTAGAGEISIYAQAGGDRRGEITISSSGEITINNDAGTATISAGGLHNRMTPTEDEATLIGDLLDTLLAWVGVIAGPSVTPDPATQAKLTAISLRYKALLGG